MKDKAKISTDEELHDGFENLIASMGTEQDKRSHSRFVNNKRLSADGNRHELSALYRTDTISGKIVDIIPNDMTREWRYFSGDIEPEIVRMLEEEENNIQLVKNINQAHKWARLYGTAFIVMSIDDGNSPDKPLEIDKIKLGGLKHITAIDRYRVSHSDVVPIQDPMNSNFGLPEFYRFNETNVKIHHSRVMRFDGVQLPYDDFRENNYNSDSVLDRLYEALTNFNTTVNAAASMVYETNVDIIKIKGLMNYLQSSSGESLVRRRITFANVMKSFNNSLILDSEEEHQTKSNTFAGLPDLLDRYALYLSSGSDVPATRLLGSSASGLNATGEGDLKNYYDTVRSLQKSEYKPKLDIFDKIMAKSLGLKDDIDLSYEFISLFQMTTKEKADTEYVNAQRDQIYLDRGVITEEIVAKDLKQEGTYTNITDDYIAELEESGDGFNTNSNGSKFEAEQGASEGEEKESDSGEDSEIS